MQSKIPHWQTDLKISDAGSENGIPMPFQIRTMKLGFYYILFSVLHYARYKIENIGRI